MHIRIHLILIFKVNYSNYLINTCKQQESFLSEGISFTIKIEKVKQKIFFIKTTFDTNFSTIKKHILGKRNRK